MSIKEHFNELLFIEESHKYIHKTTGIEFTGVTSLLNRFKSKPDPQVYADKHGLNVEDVIKDWKSKQAEGATKGKDFHTIVENYFKEHTIVEHPMFHQLLSFEKEYMPMYEIVDLEIMVYNLYYKLSGTGDVLLRNRFGQYKIGDWKTNKKIDKRSFYNKKLINGLEHLEDCELSIYSLQTSLYRYMIEKMIPNLIWENKNVIVWFNEKNESYKVFETPYLKTEVELILQTLLPKRKIC